MHEEELRQHAKKLNDELIDLVKALGKLDNQRTLLQSEIKERWGALREVRKLANLDPNTGQSIGVTLELDKLQVPEVIKNLENMVIEPTK